MFLFNYVISVLYSIFDNYLIVVCPGFLLPLAFVSIYMLSECSLIIAVNLTPYNLLALYVNLYSMVNLNNMMVKLSITKP